MAVNQPPTRGVLRAWAIILLLVGTGLALRHLVPQAPLTRPVVQEFSGVVTEWEDVRRIGHLAYIPGLPLPVLIHVNEAFVQSELEHPFNISVRIERHRPDIDGAVAYYYGWEWKTDDSPWHVYYATPEGMASQRSFFDAMMFFCFVGAAVLGWRAYTTRPGQTRDQVPFF